MADFLKSFLEDDTPTFPEDELPVKESDSLFAEFRYRSTVEKVEIRRFRKSMYTFLNKSVIFYGPSGSGKTTLIYDYMDISRSLFPIVYVFAPTNEEKHDFDGIVPGPLIFEDFTIDNIKKIYLRQKAATSTYNKANQPEVLRGLFRKVANAGELKMMGKIEKEKERMIALTQKKYNDPSYVKAKKDEIEDNFLNFANRFSKKVIARNLKKLRAMPLDDAEELTLNYLYLNPRTLIIFDDATTELLALIKEGKKKDCDAGEILKHFFFKGRWANITHWYAFHDDNKLDTDIRKNAFYSIFCDKPVALAFFQRAANSFSTGEKKRAEAVIDKVFSDDAPPHAKLVYARLEKKFYYVVADNNGGNFTMCSPIVRDFCAKVESKKEYADKSNPYTSIFRSAGKKN